MKTTEEMSVEEEITKLTAILNSTTSIKNHIEEFGRIREAVLPVLTPIQQIELTNKAKSKIQAEVNQALDELGGTGAVIGATGTGKTKIVIDRISRNTTNMSLIVVPTIKLRDITWKDEFEKWNKLAYYINNVKMICYDSLTSIKGMSFHTIYFDEAHNITETHLDFFENNKVEHIVPLTATKPTNKVKREILGEICPCIAYEITVDEAVKLGVIAPYDIAVITYKLDSKDKYIAAGNKIKRFFTTETAQYAYMTKKAYGTSGTKWDLINRMKFLYTTRSKENAARNVLQMFSKNVRLLLFCGSISQSIELWPFRYFSKPTIKRKDTEEGKAKSKRLLELYRGDEDFNAFCSGEINWLACIDAINEGQNIEDMDYIFLIVTDSNPIKFTQRLGRNLRFRPGHIGKVIMLAAEDTVEIDWIKKVTKKLSVDKITFVKLEDLVSRAETIFN